MLFLRCSRITAKVNTFATPWLVPYVISYAAAYTKVERGKYLQGVVLDNHNIQN